MQPHDKNWRDLAINDALRRAGSGSKAATNAILQAVRENWPSSTTILVWPDRNQVLPFLQRKAEDVRSVCSGQGGIEYDSYDQKEEAYPFYAWYAAAFEGSHIEIALPPTSDSDIAIAVGDDAGAVARFAKAIKDFTHRPSGRSLRYSEGWEDAPDLDQELGKVDWKDIVMPEETLRGLRDSAESFFSHREAMKALGFAWRRGILLVGPPGTGKTMVCKAIAAALPELPFLYVRDLREDDQKEAIGNIFQRARKLAPCILTFEDIDGLVTEQTRTIFLNEMDGFQNNDGLLVIASSNHPGKIDEALLKRPSRFDRVFHIGPPKLAERREFCLRIFSRSALGERIAPSLNRENLAQQVAEKSEGFTPAYIKEALTSAALQMAQQGQTNLDARFAEAVLAQVDELRGHLKRMKDPDALAMMSSGDTAVGFRRGLS